MEEQSHVEEKDEEVENEDLKRASRIGATLSGAQAAERSSAALLLRNDLFLSGKPRDIGPSANI